MLTVNDLCAKALVYLKTVDIKNKPSGFNPSSTYYKYLATGTIINSYSRTVTLRGHRGRVSYPEEYPTKTLTEGVKNTGTIPTEYKTAVSDATITSDWNNYRDNYILPKFNNKYISISTLFSFLYLFKYFVDTRFCLFSDAYTSQQVWLYKTGSVSYSPQIMQVDITELNNTNLSNIFSILLAEVVQRSNHAVLSTGVAAYQNSSSSSSCSSSCCSSSCSSSSFIIYFNLH